MTTRQSILPIARLMRPVTTGAEKVTVALSGGALLVAALSAWFARVQLNAARAANALTVLIDVFNGFRGEKLRASLSGAN